MTKIIFSVFLLISSTLTFAQELNDLEIKRTRSIQEKLISNPEEAYKEALEISNSNKELFKLHGEFYVANYFYNKSEFIHSKKLLLELIKNLEYNPKIKSSKEYQDLLGMCINKLFYVHKNLGEYDLVLLFLDKYKKIVPNKNFYEQYGTIKVAMGDYVNGIALLKKELQTSSHLKLGVGCTYSN